MDEHQPTQAYTGDFTTVARALDATEAHVLGSYLKSCGIPAVVVNANLSQAAPFIGGPVGNADVRVPAAYVQEARDLIANFDRAEISEEASANAEDVPAYADSAYPFRGKKKYAVYVHPDQPVPIVVKAGFSWGAFFFGPLWFLLNGMWLNFMLVTAFYIGGHLYFAGSAVRGEGPWVFGIFVAYLIGWFLIGKFAHVLLAARLEEKGYQRVAFVSAENPTYAREAALRHAGAGKE